jgi:hypothetical protein
MILIVELKLKKKKKKNQKTETVLTIPQNINKKKRNIYNRTKTNYHFLVQLLYFHWYAHRHVCHHPKVVHLELNLQDHYILFSPLKPTLH